MFHNLRKIVLIAALSAALATPARADGFQTIGDEIVVGIVVVSAGIAVLVTYLVLHERHKPSALTGCVAPGPAGMSVTDEKDKRIYTLAGDPVGVKAGDRLTFEGKRKKAGNAFVFDARSVTKDFGSC
jgi:hypothetical protein